MHNDYLQLEINGGKIFLNYNLGSKDITIGDTRTKVNDGQYHVVRFTRSDINSTLQVDDNPIERRNPQGNKHQSKTTVFNDQSVLSIGGRRNTRRSANKVARPFQGIIAGVVYNNLKPLELAANDNEGIHILGTVRELSTGIPFDYKQQNPQFFTPEYTKKLIDAMHNAKTFEQRGEPYVDNSQGFINCDDEEDCAAGSGSGSGPPTSVVDDTGEDTPVYEPSPAGNEESEDLSQIGTEGSRYVPITTHVPFFS